MQARWMAVVFSLAALPSLAAAQGSGSWVDALVALRPAPVEADAPVDMRIKEVRRLGRYADERVAVELLLARLAEEPGPELRREILLALAGLASPASIPALSQELKKKDQDPEPVLVALGATGEPAAAAALVKALGRPETADKAADALERMGAVAVEPLAEQLGREGAERAARVLGAIGDRRAIPALIGQVRARGIGNGVRLTAVEALQAIGDRRAGPAVAALLGEETDPVLRQAAVEALGRVGTKGQASALLKELERNKAGDALPALRALAAIDSRRAVPELKKRLFSGEEREAKKALEVLHDYPRARFVPLLLKAFESGMSETATASALARVPDGAGTRALVDFLAGNPGRIDAAALAVAAGLRRWRFALDEASRASGFETVQRAIGRERRMLARALARDPGVSAELARSLGSGDARLRAAAALGMELLGPPGQGEALLRALKKESDPEAFRRQATAALGLGVDAPPGLVWRWISDPATAPEAMLLLARSAAVASPADRRRLARELRRDLRSLAAGPRCRAAAALALALMRDRSARRVLEAALGDRSPRVRLAVVRAMGFLALPGSGRALRRQAALETEATVRGEASRALRAVGRTLGSEPLLVRGRETLHLGLLVSPGKDPDAVLLDVLLVDGRWLRIRPTREGSLVLGDLGSETVEVRMVDSHAAY